jgi:hypothetical protein
MKEMTDGADGQLQSTGWPCSSLRTCLRAHVYTYIENEGGIELTRRLLFTNKKVTLKLQLNDKVVGHTKLGKNKDGLV